MKNLQNLLEEKGNEILSVMANVYNEGAQSYNTDIIVYDDGDIKTHNYFGNCGYYNKDIAAVMTISSEMKNEAFDSLIMTEEEIEVCQQKGWIACMEGDINTQFEWDEMDMVDEYEYWKESMLEI